MAYISKYTGKQVDNILDSVSDKQDIIIDLATIRAGAEKGSTALQREQYTGTYSKPSSGIPKSDLASAVQSSLNKADTALQVETYKGTVTGVKMNGQTKGTSGIVDLGTVLTQHQDLSSKQDKLVSGNNIKTINGKSLLGSGNLIIEGGSGGSADLTGYATEIWVEGKGYAVQSEVEEDLATKQDKITDLATIRSGAAKGATSVQNTEIAKVAKSGSYNDLTNKPTIPAAVTETTVTGWGFTKNTGTYSKPSGGIPKTDLAPAVQTSLDSVESKLDKPIVFDVDAANITLGDGGDIDGSFTAAQLQAATGMAPADFTAAILSGRRVCVSLSQGTVILLQMAYILDGSGIQLTFNDGAGSMIVVLQVGYSSGEGSINQGSLFSFFYTKDEVNYLIASAITSTLNTAV